MRVIDLWESSTLDELAEEIGAPRYSISSMAKRIRKNGVDLTKKRRGGYIESLVKEVISEYKKKNGNRSK